MSRPFLQHYLPFLLVRADTLLSRRWMADLADSGHSVAEWRILATLADARDVTIGELAELVLLPQPTVSRWVDRLETRGLVQRAGGDADRRRTHVHITAGGRRVAAEMTAVADGHLVESLAAVDPADVAELQRIVHAIIDGVSNTVTDHSAAQRGE